jgi:hypothetical protein
MLASAVFALAIIAGFLTPGASAKGSIIGNCATMESPELPCAASDGQTYGTDTLPNGEDSEGSLEAVLGYVEGEPTDVSSIAFGLTGDTAEFDFQFPDAPDDESFSWSYSGRAPLAFLTVTTDQGAFGVYDVAKRTHGEIDVLSELSEFENTIHFSFWQRTYSQCEPVRVEDSHAKGMIPGCQLSEIVGGKVPCVHVSKEATKTCHFRTTGNQSGKWLEGAQHGDDAEYAMAGQGITRKGKPGGPWVVATKATHDAVLPCKKAPPANPRRHGSVRDTPSTTTDSSLPFQAVEETPGSTFNRIQLLDNFATREICTNTATHPDGAMQSSHPSPAVYCYSGKGAGLNDSNGMERRSPAEGGGYYNDPQHHHVIRYLGALVPAAKRPNTKPNGEVIANSPIAWRTVNPNAKIAN